ncbi:hypothetical protein [Streptomyces prunicolor]|uniref:hypothetical protein n=1 Tax=Streptomyces prunicolor TaxID=67348 RepID=UPI00036C0ABA|nr:hypothetical protein [Streptomyces prunicolor]
MSALGRLREALTGGPRYTPAVGPHASTRDQEKNGRKRGRELDQAEGRRARHRASVLKNGDAGDGTKFAFEQKRGWRRRS